MSWADEEKAWATVPDAITIVVDKMERVYFEGERRDDIRPTLHSDVALFNGAPVIILHPVGGAKGGYVEHPVYNTGGVGQWQDEQFEIALKNIKAHKWDSYYAKKAGITVEEYNAQKEAGVKNPAPQVIQEVMPTPEQCHWQFEQDLITEHGLNKWHRGMYRCICRQRSCVHFRNGR
jgi:hypothetical protein